MSVKINLVSEINKIEKILDKKILIKAVKRAMRRTRATMKRETLSRIQKHVANIKLKDFNKKISRLKTELRGSKIDRFAIILDISDRPLSLLNFVVGSKEPRKQKGIPVAQRKKIKLRYIKGGRTKVAHDLFIAKGRGGRKAVYRRTPGTKSVGSGFKRTNPNIKAQAGPVIWVKFKDQAFRLPIEKAIAERFTREFRAAYDFFIKKANV